MFEHAALGFQNTILSQILTQDMQFFRISPRCDHGISLVPGPGEDGETGATG